MEEYGKRESCLTCKFWKWRESYRDSGWDGEMPNVSPCRRFPPVLNAEFASDIDAWIGEGQQPRTQPFDWCGEYVAADNSQHRLELLKKLNAGNLAHLIKVIDGEL